MIEIQLQVVIESAMMIGRNRDLSQVSGLLFGWSLRQLDREATVRVKNYTSQTFRGLCVMASNIDEAMTNSINDNRPMHVAEDEDAKGESAKLVE